MNLRRVSMPATLTAQTCLGVHRWLMETRHSPLNTNRARYSIFVRRIIRTRICWNLETSDVQRNFVRLGDEKSTDEDEERKRNDCRDERVQSGKLKRYGYRWQRSLKYTFFRGRVYRVTYVNETARVQIRRRYLFQRCFELSSLSSPYFNRKMARCRRQEKRRIRPIVERWLKGIARSR